MVRKTQLLIIGAGPYGLALGLYAQQHQIDYIVAGKVMDFWETNMPSGMQLRTPFDWHNEQELALFLKNHSLNNDAINPVPRELLIDFIRWSINERNLNVIQEFVQKVDSLNHHFNVLMENGETLLAEKVVIATGYYPYQRIPEEFNILFPKERFSHNADCVDFQQLQGKRCLIVGGRQGAFEWAGLLSEYAAHVDIVYRHDTPEFTPSDWSWVYPLIEKTRKDPGWFRRLSQTEKDAIDSKFWFEGRGQLEDWLVKKYDRDNVKIWPNTSVSQCKAMENGNLKIGLNNGAFLEIDHIILATGYQVDVKKLPILAAGNLADRLRSNDGYPILDVGLQSNIPGLYFTGIHAVKDFGPMFFFVACAFAAANIIGEKVG